VVLVFLPPHQRTLMKYLFPKRRKRSFFRRTSPSDLPPPFCRFGGHSDPPLLFLVKRYRYFSFPNTRANDSFSGPPPLHVEFFFSQAAPGDRPSGQCGRRNVRALRVLFPLFLRLEAFFLPSFFGHEAAQFVSFPDDAQKSHFTFLSLAFFPADRTAPDLFPPS